jgi:hypothetical protein
LGFKSIFNKVSTKFNLINSSIPDVAKDLQNNINNAKNAFSVEGLKEQALGQVAGLTGPAGSNLFASMDPAQFKSNLSAKPGPIGFTTKAGTLVPGQSQPPWPNELEPFASMSTLVTFACLTHKEISDPDNTYRKTGLNNVVIKAGGGAGDKKHKTQVELALGSNVEFFIDNLDIGCNIVPSISYGTNSNTTKITFEVSEPYSMGLFYQALSMAAMKAGFADYTQCPFVLKIEFKGWDVDGNAAYVPYSTRLIPISLVRSEFSVNEGGSLYQVEAIAWNERALRDSVQQVKTTLNITGNTVKEILQSGAKSVTSVMNKRLQDMEKQGQVNVADQFVILFPDDRASASSPVADGSIQSSATSTPSLDMMDVYNENFATADDQAYGGSSANELSSYWQSYSGSDSEVPANFDEYLTQVSGNVVSSSWLGKGIKKYAQSDFSNNKIGQAKMIDTPFETGTNPLPDPAYVRGSLDAFAAEVQSVADQNAAANEQQKADNDAFAEKYPIFSSSVASSKLDGKLRSYTFSAGSRLQEIIEEVLITSMYGRELKNQLKDVKDPTGMVDWYRIETACYPVPTNSEIGKTGKVPCIYIYRVVPYKVQAEKFMTGTEAPPGIANLKAQAAKEYNYIYTGRNKDILDFQIQYNNSFIYPTTADRGSSTAAQRAGPAGSQTVSSQSADETLVTGESKRSLKPGETAKTQADVVNTGTGNAGGSGYDNTAISVARMFNDRLLHSQVDMLLVDMTIMGDPFYLSDNGIGNYFAQDTSYTNITTDGSANFLNSELYINILFRTPLDTNPEQGNYIFPEDLVVVDTFSGLYRVNMCNHLIQQNQYTTVLKLNRMLNQEDQTQTKNLGSFVATDNPAAAMNESAVAFASKVSEAMLTTGATENLLAYKKEVELLLGSYQGLNDLISSQAQSLGLPALDAFGNIGSVIGDIQSKLGLADLGKIGSSFADIQSSIGGDLANLKTAATSFATSTLSQVNLNGSNVLGKFGTDITNTVGNIAGGQNLANKISSTVKMQIPTNIEAAATRGADEISKLNSKLKGPF